MANEVVIDRLVSELVLEADTKSFDKAAAQQKKLADQAIATAKAIDKVAEEQRELAEMSKLVAERQREVTKETEDLRHEIQKSGKATAEQRAQLRKLAETAAKLRTTQAQLRDGSMKLRTSQQNLEVSARRTDATMRRLAAGVATATRAYVANQREGGKLGRILKAAGNGVVEGSKGFARAGAMAAGVTAAIGVPILTTAANFEKLQKQLVAVTGSETKAIVAFDQILKLAKDTPFQVENMTASFSRLKAVGIEPTVERMTAFANIAAANSKDILDFAEAVADASTGENERLKEFGIVGKKVGEQVEYTFDGVTTKVERNAEAITDYLTQIGETRFAGAAAMQMDTISGKISNLQDQFGMFALAVGKEGVGDNFKKLLDRLAEIMGNDDLVQIIAKFLNDGLQRLLELLDELGEDDIEKFLRGLFSALSTVSGVTMDLVKAGIALLEVFKDSPAVIEGVTLALIAMSAAGGGLPGMFAAVGAAGFAAGQAIAEAFYVALGGINDVEQAIIEAQNRQKRQELEDREEAAQEKLDKIGEDIKATQERDQASFDKAFGGFGEGLTKDLSDTEKQTLGVFTRADVNDEFAAKQALTPEGRQVFYAVQAEERRQLDAVQAQADAEARKAGKSDDEVLIARGRAFQAKKAQLEASRSATFTAASKKFGETGSAEQAAATAARAVSGEKEKKPTTGGGRGRGAGGASSTSRKHSTTPFDELTKTLARPPVLHITNNRYDNRIMDNEFTAKVSGQFTGTPEAVGNGAAATWERQIGKLLRQQAGNLTNGELR
jgi:hypothetical protein